MPTENHKTTSGTQDSTSWFFGDGDNRIFGKSQGQSFELCVSEGKSKRVPVEHIPFGCRKLYANSYVGDCYVCPQLNERCFVPDATFQHGGGGDSQTEPAKIGTAVPYFPKVPFEASHLSFGNAIIVSYFRRLGDFFSWGALPE